MSSLSSLCGLVAVLVLSLDPRTAHAQSRVLVMADEGGPDIAAALRVELANRSTEVLVSAAPAGQSRVERAASAQASARGSGSNAAVWLDTIDGAAGRVPMVRVAPSADADFRQAPLPPEGALDPRAIAMIASSLLEEMLGPPDPPPATELDIHAELDVHVRAEAPSAVPDATPAPVPDAVPPVVAAPESTPIIVEQAAAAAADEVDADEDRSDVEPFANVTLGGRALGLDDVLDGGVSMRGAVGLRFERTWRLALELESLLASEHPGLETGDIGGGVSFGVSGGGEIALGRDCALVLTTYLHAAQQRSWDWRVVSDARTFETYWAWAVRWGVRAAVAIPIARGTRLEIGLELGLFARSANDRSAFRGDIAVLTIGVSWQ